ncbi:ATP-grasp fold amidoligase family protein [Schlesneria sp. T3-172]|uniref:ATP-grasp fold amidoligase family protein n=1 Tax=Schlesneria sphaerica TaxID=3373610 RepID=UPI0037CC9BE2
MASILDSLPSHREGVLSLAFRRWQIQNRFYRRFGTYVNFNNPQTVNEKVQYRKLFGNQQLYALLADKYLVRQFVEERVGGGILIPLLGVHDRLTQDAFDHLPDSFIIKANHGCKWHQIVRDKSTLDVKATCRRFNQFLGQNYAKASGEYHYTFIKPRIIIEQLLDDAGDSPVDYNFFCYNSSEGFEYCLSVSTPRLERHVHFEPHGDGYEGTCSAEEVGRLRNPKNFDRMVSIAQALSRGFDFMRVDLYNLNGAIYFGEMTSTPASGMRAISNPVRAELRSRLWKLDTHNPLLYRPRKAA